MDRATVEVYEQRAEVYARSRPPAHRARAERLAAAALPSFPLLDAGCGPGGYAPDLASSGAPVVALDAAWAMVTTAADAAPGVLPVNGDLERLPLRRGSLGGCWARNSYLHVARAQLPRALASLHHALAVGAPIVLSVLAGDDEGLLADDDLPGRRFSRWRADALADVAVGAGFEDVRVETVTSANGHGTLWLTAVRARSLADTVGPGMGLLVCGLNPSIYAADRGVGFARPGNRFWPAAVAAGIVTRPFDPWHALDAHGVGMTDLVKRATVGADELTRDEYAAGLDRVTSSCAWLRPAAVAFVGLDGWRTAVDRRATPGWQPSDVGGVPAYVLPSTSGRNARTSVAELADHLRRAAAGPP